MFERGNSKNVMFQLQIYQSRRGSSSEGVGWQGLRYSVCRDRLVTTIVCTATNKSTDLIMIIS